MDKPIVLVVEDNEIQRKVIKLLAAEFGFEVILRASHNQAQDADAVGGDIYSLVLMRLPDQDGNVCAKYLQEIRLSCGRSVPIVAMTGFMGSDDKAKCLALGFDDCLIKPFSSNEFRQMVLRWSCASNSNIVPWPIRAKREEQI